MRHYPGGLAEWMASSAPLTADTALRTTNGAPRTPHSAPRPPISQRFIDALADQSVGGLFRLWIEIVAIGGVAFWALDWLPAHSLQTSGGAIKPDGSGFFSALYFSAVTATSVGYGDIVPIGFARVLAIAESVAGLVIFGCVISKFVSRRQEQLIGEIHRIAFEDRLGRVRTNLHLVRTEVQATSRLCEGHDIAPAAAVARVESIAMVFIGELHAVHDVLYRPQRAPDEPVLEAILATLASVFQEFNELVRCVEVQRAVQPAALHANLTTMSRLAGEICGDCVPRQYAPALRRWMDQIQRIAGELTQI